MSDDLDKTVYSSKGASELTGTPDQQPKKRNPLLIIGGVGCALLLCAALLIGGGAYYFLTSDSDNLIANLLGSDDASAPATVEDLVTTEPEISSPTPTPEATSEASAEAGDESAQTATDEAESSADSGASVSDEPEIGSITFALGATDEYDPISPAAAFDEGITEIHAIFDYSGMSVDYTWERVWYLDGEEILRNSEQWTDPAMGRFDYFLDAGGAPLPAGEWVLEIYVEGELLATDSFTIEAEEEPTPIAQATPTPSATPTTEPSATPTTAAAASGGGTYQLAYTKWDGGQHNLYVADTNGNNEHFLFNRAAGPSWTPDGKQIFFFGEEGVDRQRLADGREFVFDGVSNGIVVMLNASARPNPDQATLFQGVDWKQGTARWANVSPDGNMVAFDARPGGSDYRIYFLGTADNQQFRFEILGEQADWSPDSQRIVYRSGRDGKTGIWISNRDDSGHTPISNNGSDSFPAWSPNGRQIAFARDEGGNVDIYTMNVDGSNVQRLTDAPGPDSLPVYTPSGDIIFRSARSGSWGIWKMSGTGTGQGEIIPNAGVGPDWSYSKMDVH